MRYTFDTTIKFFLYFEFLVFTGWYCWSGTGLQALLSLKRENTELSKSIAQLNDQIQALEREAHDWKTYSFYKEKMAREQLQMAQKGDIVYFL